MSIGLNEEQYLNNIHIFPLHFLLLWYIICGVKSGGTWCILHLSSSQDHQQPLGHAQHTPPSNIHSHTFTIPLHKVEGLYLTPLWQHGICASMFVVATRTTRRTMLHWAIITLSKALLLLLMALSSINYHYQICKLYLALCYIPNKLPWNLSDP